MSKKDALNSLVAATVILATISKDNPYMMDTNMFDNKYMFMSNNRGKGKGRNKGKKHWERK